MPPTIHYRARNPFPDRTNIAARRSHAWSPCGSYAVRCSLFAVAVLLTSCTEPPQSPTGPADLTSSVSGDSGTITPLCELGCTDTDPYPSAPGYFIGNDFTADNCTDRTFGNDTDQDWLVDNCEKRLAEKFAPQLYYAYTYDDVRREPYWAARRDGAAVRIGYLFSYYRDLGSDTWACRVPFPHYLCAPHNGDSEAVFLEIYCNNVTKHWVLGSAWYSQHGNYVNYDRGSSAYPTALEYPGKAGGYPRTWVAENKHANYPTRSACNNGGVADTDTCVNNNTGVRVQARAIWNIGSRSHPFYDCVSSRDPAYEYYGAGRTECFWTQKDFRGWIPNTVGGGHAGPYSTILANQGF